MTQRAGPLDGVRVLEIGTGRSGAFACAILADLGADVVTVVPPDTAGTDGRPAATARRAFDRGKRSVAADPARPGADDLAGRLVGWADVVVEEDPSWRAGLADGPVPGATVHCSITPFGDGPGPASDPGSEDLLVQALSGNMDLTGFAGGPPCEAGIPVADLATGAYAVIGVLACVLSGGSSRVRVAKIDVAVALLSYMAVGYFADGDAPTRVGTGHSTIFPYNAFRAADGEVVVAPFTGEFWRNFAAATGREDLADDERYRSFGRRLRAKDELLAVFTPILAGRSVDEWVSTFAESDVPAGPVLTLDGAVTLEQTLARGMVATVTGATGAGSGGPDGPGGPVRTVGSPFRFRRPDGSTVHPQPGTVPGPGADTDAVRAELGRTAS